MLRTVLLEAGYPMEFIEQFAADVHTNAQKIAEAEKGSDAAKEAKRKGLHSIGAGRWANNADLMVAKTDAKTGKLVMVKPQKAEPSKEKSAKQEPEKTDGKKSEKPSAPAEKPTAKKPPTDATKAPAFNTPVTQDKDFYAKSKGILVSKAPFSGITSTVKNPLYPKKYAQVLERMLSTTPVGDAAKVGYYTEGSAGAGTTQSKAGELAVMLFTSMNDQEFDALYPKMVAYADAAEKSGKKPALEKSWIEAAKNCRNSTLQRFQKQYPGGKLVGTAWDVPDEVEALGLPYDKKEASTDVFYKIQMPDGSVIVDQSSLKKDAGAALLNPGAGVLNKWDDKLPKDVDPNTFYEQRRQRYIAAAKQFAPQLAAKLGTTKNKVLWKEIYTKADALAKKGDKKAAAFIQQMETDFTDWNRRLVKEMSRNPKLINGVLTDISEALPIKGILSGKESISIGNTSFDKFTAREIFGTDDFNLIKTRLTVVSPKEGPPYLSYKAGKDVADIPVAKFRLKDESGRYSVNAKFILDLHKGFADSIKAAHKKVYGQVL
jgi:hypothetical protein